MDRGQGTGEWSDDKAHDLIISLKAHDLIISLGRFLCYLPTLLAYTSSSFSPSLPLSLSLSLDLSRSLNEGEGGTGGGEASETF